MIVTSIPIAEMLKYVNNSFHALKVTFANEIGRLCKRGGHRQPRGDAALVLDTRSISSPDYLSPGFAFGGSCLPKDLRAIAARSRQHGLELPVLRNIMRSNDVHVEEAIHLIERLKRRRVGVLGLSFKADTDDLRESPILRVIGDAGRQGLLGAAARSQHRHGARARRESRVRRERGAVPARAPARRRSTRCCARARWWWWPTAPPSTATVGALLGAGQVLVDLAAAVDPAQRAPRGLPWPRLVGFSTSRRT